MQLSTAQDVLDFWFAPEQAPLWFVKSDDFDTKIRERFAELHTRAAQGELWKWRATAQGRLAEIIVLDQFSRNLFRDQPAAFAQDTMAVVLVQEAVALRLDQELDTTQRKFLYMPFMHSESKVIHEEAYRLFEQLGDALTLDFEIKHKVIIDRFGRYPHRNAVLGRTSSAEEIAFLQEPNSSF